MAQQTEAQQYQHHAHDRGTGAGEHAAGQRYRPMSWAVVAFIIGAFALGGAAIIVAIPWLAWLAVGLIALGSLVGWATHILADEGGELPTDPIAADRGRAGDTSGGPRLGS